MATCKGMSGTAGMGDLLGVRQVSPCWLGELGRIDWEWVCLACREASRQLDRVGVYIQDGGGAARVRVRSDCYLPRLVLGSSLGGVL